MQVLRFCDSLERSLGRREGSCFPNLVLHSWSAQPGAESMSQRAFWSSPHGDVELNLLRGAPAPAVMLHLWDVLEMAQKSTVRAGGGEHRAEHHHSMQGVEK